MHSIVLLHNQLRRLNSAHAALDGAALSVFSSRPWPSLNSLNRTGNDLKAEAVSNLVLAEMETLSCLTLADTMLDATAAKHLARGTWSFLTFRSTTWKMLPWHSLLKDNG